MTAAFVAVLLTIQLVPDQVHVGINDVARDDVVAQRSVRYADHLKTELLRKFAATQVARTYSDIAGAQADARKQTVGFFTAVAELRDAQAGAGVENPLQTLRQQYPGIPPEHLAHALTMGPETVRAAERAAASLVDQAMQRPVTPESLPDARAGVRRAAADAQLPSPTRNLLGEVAAAGLVANQFYNERETETARRRERDQIPTQYETIRRGDVVLRRGDRVNLEHVIKLRELGLIRPSLDLVTVSSLVLLAFGLVAVCSLYLYQFHPHILRSLEHIVLLCVVVCGSLLLFRVLSTTLGVRFSGDQLGYLGMLCSALGAMLIAALLCPQVAVFVGVALSLLTSVLVGSELKFAMVSIVSSLTAVQAVRLIRNRADILRAGFVISAVNVVTALVAQGATEAALPDNIPMNVLWCAVGGFGSVTLFTLSAAWLERPFRLTTHLTLLELSDPSQPLLRRLQVEAPGTYHHSIIVGNLSEAAADTIGADALFCRVASYYHDIGKVIRPQFFIENQTYENRHNSINPSLSALVVTSHVKDGVELAEEHRLPQPLISIIREHHGTCLVKYFYHQALSEQGDESTASLEYRFRYQGPRPQSKESGVIMLADSVEAASRTLDKPSPGRIRELIERIVRDRLSDGQLDECELTFKDLEKIIASLTRSVVSLLHARVEYPTADTSQLRRLAANGSAHKEPLAARTAPADTPEAALTIVPGPPRP